MVGRANAPEKICAQAGEAKTKGKVEAGGGAPPEQDPAHPAKHHQGNRTGPRRPPLEPDGSHDPDAFKKAKGLSPEKAGFQRLQAQRQPAFASRSGVWSCKKPRYLPRPFTQNRGLPRLVAGAVSPVPAR